MTQQELVERMASEAKIKNKAAVGRALKSVVGAIRSEVQAGRKIGIAGLGVFEPRERKARKGRNPRTGETLDIPARRSIRFRASSSLKKAIR